MPAMQEAYCGVYTGRGCRDVFRSQDNEKSNKIRAEAQNVSPSATSRAKNFFINFFCALSSALQSEAHISYAKRITAFNFLHLEP
jgi:hypothetical protein